MIETLDKIADAKGKKKVEILRENDSILLQEIWHMAYGRHKFNTSKIVDVTIGSESNPKNFGAVVALCDKLRSKVASGNAMKLLINETLEALHPECIELYNRIIKGNLKCGIGESAGNAVWGKGFIKTFPVMLIAAHCGKKAAKILESKNGAVLQLKSDGVRGVVHGTGIEASTYQFFTRQGEQLNGLSEVFSPIIADAFDMNFISMDSDNFGIDGEFCCIREDGSHDFSKASGIMNKCIQGTATEEEVNQLTYMIWDIYFEDSPDDDYEHRLFDVESMVSTYGKLQVVPTWKVTNLDQVHEKFREIVKTGNEGVVLKSLDNKWADKRVNDCIKYKEKHQAEFVITGWYHGESGNEMQNVIGGYNIQSLCGQVLANTGSGLVFIDRGILTEMKGKKEVAIKDSDGYYIPNPDVDFDDCIGKICTIEYNQRTKDKNGRETYSLRFPIFKGIRIDKSEADTLETMIAQESATNGLRT